METPSPPDLAVWVDANDASALREFCEERHPATVAEVLEGLGNLDTIWKVLHLCPVALRAQIFPHFDLDMQVDLASGERRRDMAQLLEEMEADERADLVRELDGKVREEILPLVARAEREDIRRLASYEEGTAGSVMTTDYATLQPDVSVEQALHQLRMQAPGKETIYYIYVVDERHHIIGFVSLRKLILARPRQCVGDLMNEEILAVGVNDDQEEVARTIEKYDLLAVPVVGPDNLLVGIVTHDDALDILRQEQQEDVERFMAIGGGHAAREYLSTPAWEHFLNRVGWVVVLGMFGLVSGLVIQRNTALLAVIPLLAVFIPMLAGTGGNTGSQAATLVVRALALEEITARDLFRVLGKELMVALLLGIALSGVAFGRVMLAGKMGGTPEGMPLWYIGLVVSLALGLQVVSSTLLGALLPMVASRFRVDPALVASPALSTCVDISGMLIFFGVAGALLS